MNAGKSLPGASLIRIKEERSKNEECHKFPLPRKFFGLKEDRTWTNMDLHK